MRAEDLHHKGLLELDPGGGVVRFAGQRVLLLDAVAMGISRQYLFDNFGLTAARAVPTQFGFAHGWREELIPESQREGNVHHATGGMIVGFPVMMALDVALG